MADTLDALRTELTTLLGSWEYAFAMGHGCTIGARDPRLEGTVQRVDALRAMILERS